MVHFMVLVSTLAARLVHFMALVSVPSTHFVHFMALVSLLRGEHVLTSGVKCAKEAHQGQ